MKIVSRRSAGLTGLALTAALFIAAPATVTAIPSDGTTSRTVGPAAVAAQSSTPRTVAPAAAAGTPKDGTTRRKVRVRGEQVPVDVASGTYVMRGDLVGDWRYIPRTPPLHNSATLYVESGTEIFNGCIDRNGNGRCGRRDHRGELHLAFIYWAYLDLDGNLIRGRCTHPITGGSGAFTGARGVLNMYDVPRGDVVETTYRGRVVLNAVPSEAPVTATPTTASSTADKATSKTPMRRAC